MARDKEKQPVLRPHRLKRWVFFVISAAICIAVGFATFQFMPENNQSKKTDESGAKGRVVTVRSVEPGTYTANITAFGEVVPSRRVTVKSQVEGQVLFLSERLETGNLVKEGELLVRVEQSGFKLQVADADNRLTIAKIGLMKEEREAGDALVNWLQSGIEGEPVSPLVLRGPQLAAARTEVEAAEAALLHAQAMLMHTEIRAPFDAMVIRRDVDPGEILFAADKIATLFGTESVEISIYIDPESWSLLPKPIGRAKVKLFDTEQGACWRADVVRKSFHLDGESRLRTLILQVQQPMNQATPLLPGTFVRAEIKGRQVDQMLRIPEFALTKHGIIWFVDNNKRLRKYHVEPLFYGVGAAYIHVPVTTEESPLLIALYPNSSFVDGLVVQPLPEKNKPDDR